MGRKTSHGDEHHVLRLKARGLAGSLALPALQRAERLHIHAVGKTRDPVGRNAGPEQILLHHGAERRPPTDRPEEAAREGRDRPQEGGPPVQAGARSGCAGLHHERAAEASRQGKQREQLITSAVEMEDIELIPMTKQMPVEIGAEPIRALAADGLRGHLQALEKLGGAVGFAAIHQAHVHSSVEEDANQPTRLLLHAGDADAALQDHPHAGARSVRGYRRRGGDADFSNRRAHVTRRSGRNARRGSSGHGARPGPRLARAGFEPGWRATPACRNDNILLVMNRAGAAR